MSHPSRQDAGFDAPRIDLLSLGWERVQWIIEARPATIDAADDKGPTVTADPMAFRLRHDDGGRNGTAPLEVAPTRGTIEGDHLRLRFNVMQGPASCRWHQVGGGSSTRRPRTPARRRRSW